MILSVGELMWDMHVEPGTSLETGEVLRRVPGGAAANVALGLAQQGVPAAVAGTVSDDPLGRGLCEALAARGVDASRVTRASGRTGVVFLERNEPSSERFVSYRPTVGPFTGCDLPVELRALHIAALNPVAEELVAFARLAEAATRAGAWVLIDVNARPLPWREPLDPAAGEALDRLAHAATAIKFSDADLERLEPTFPNAAERLGKGGATTLLTCGAKKTQVTGPWGRLEREPPKVPLVRSIGAGDAFCAGLLERIHALDPESSPTVTASLWSELLDAGHREAARRVSTAW